MKIGAMLLCMWTIICLNHNFYKNFEKCLLLLHFVVKCSNMLRQFLLSRSPNKVYHSFVSMVSYSVLSLRRLT